MYIWVATEYRYINLTLHIHYDNKCDIDTRREVNMTSEGDSTLKSNPDAAIILPNMLYQHLN
ncbi:hypothetical protein B7P43_G09489 [Cryptotermes secundus]|uniref:Uncharacterized protein n=1 Tax=Cryptotermes secundus TaxID=105785 RepID=A0A2J7PXG6_9NEOP|nr:hypothetical protein B7P43_G09489 [Cryptotermes secundus]